MDITWIREQVRRYPNKGVLHLSQGTRGAMIGRLESVIAEAARTVNLPLSTGRDIRLHLAGEIFGRRVHSFNELADAEVWALDRWVLEKQAAGLEDWLKANYAQQIPLFVEAENA